MKNKIIFLVLVAAFLITVFTFPHSPYIVIGDTKVKIELAKTPEEQTRGLSGRTTLAEGEGMLFVFPEPGRHNFWMKEMNFDIDMIWFNENEEIIYIKKRATPSSYPEAFGPDQDSTYVLEVPAGFSERHNLKIGDKAKLKD